MPPADFLGGVILGLLAIPAMVLVGFVIEWAAGKLRGQ